MFLETPRFPETVSFALTGGPAFSTDIVETYGGQEARVQNWAQAKRKYEASNAARLPAIYRPLQAFFHIAAGRANGFRFKDWLDYQDNDAGGAGVFVMLTSTTFQMVKRYTTGSSTHDRNIQKPVSPIVVTGGSGASVNYATGVVTVSSGTPTAWSGAFDVPCRFDTDEMHGEIVDKAGNDFIMAWNQIPIVEIRL